MRWSLRREPSHADLLSLALLWLLEPPKRVTVLHMLGFALSPACITTPYSALTGLPSITRVCTLTHPKHSTREKNLLINTMHATPIVPHLLGNNPHRRESASAVSLLYHAEINNSCRVCAS